jgi:hypothetical protein
MGGGGIITGGDTGGGGAGGSGGAIGGGGCDEATGIGGRAISGAPRPLRSCTVPGGGVLWISPPGVGERMRGPGCTGIGGGCVAIRRRGTDSTGSGLGVRRLDCATSRVASASNGPLCSAKSGRNVGASSGDSGGRARVISSLARVGSPGSGGSACGSSPESCIALAWRNAI